jgi:hypothetical protein
MKLGPFSVTSRLEVMMRENRPDAVCANFSLTIIYFVLQFWGGESADLVTCGNSSLGMLYKVLALLVAPLQLSHKWQKTPAVAALHHKSMESCKPSWDLRVSSSPEQPYRIWAHQVSLSMNTRGGGGFKLHIQSVQGANLTSHNNLAARLRMCGVIPPLLSVFITCFSPKPNRNYLSLYIALDFIDL